MAEINSIMNPIKDQTTSNVEPLSKILRKRKSRNNIVHNGLWDIQESRFEKHYYTVGRSSRGSGSQWVTSKRMDSYEPELLRSESTKSVPSLSSDQKESLSTRDFIENVTIRRNRYIKNIKVSITKHISSNVIKYACFLTFSHIWLFLFLFIIP